MNLLSRPSSNIHSHKKKANHNLTHTERIDEADINHDGPCQDWDEEDEAQISRHIKIGKDNEEDEGRSYKGRKAESRHDQEEDVVGD